MHGQGFLVAGFYLVVSSLFVALITAVSLSLGWLLQYHNTVYFGHLSPVAQLAVWQNVVQIIAWAVSVLFFANQHWMFDSLFWPLSPLYAALWFLNDVADASRQHLALAVAVLYGVRLNANYFRAEKLRFVGLEDWRYGDVRKKLDAWSIPWAAASYPLVYTTQWLMVFFATVPFYYIMNRPGPLDLVDVGFASVSLLGLAVEFLADSELQNFIDFHKSPTNLLVTTGLWRYSRHPNYLGECIFWTGIAGWGLWSGSSLLEFVAALNIVALFLFFSIDAMEERIMRGPRRDSFIAYKRQTSRLLLWFPATEK